MLAASGAHADWGNGALGAIACGYVVAAMTAEQARASWGEPLHVNRTMTGSHVSEQWAYDGQNYLYLEDGVVVTVQTGH